MMTRSVEVPEQAVEAAAKALRDEGGQPGHSIHSWRCEYPDRYGECDCVEVTARTMLSAALPYLAPAEVVVDHRPGESCSVAAEVDPETGFARAPAGDGGLREELERLAERMAGEPFGYGLALREILESHPAAPAVPQPADERPLRAALEKYFSNGGPDTPIRTTWHDGVEHWEAPAEDIRELIEGSAVPQPVDREALERLMERHQIGASIPSGLLRAYRVKFADDVLALLNGGGA